VVTSTGNVQNRNLAESIVRESLRRRAARKAHEASRCLSERDYQDYQSIYLDIHAELRRGADSDKESIIDDVVFEIELVKQVEVNVDYILMLVEQYREERGDGTDREVETLAKIRRAGIRRLGRQGRVAPVRRSQARRGARVPHFGRRARPVTERSLDEGPRRVRFNPDDGRGGDGDPPSDLALLGR
jgi:hypothetical protein